MPATALPAGVTVEPHPTVDGYLIVRLDGRPIGTVNKGTRSSERRTAGRRYVNSRRDVPCWWWSSVGARGYGDERTRKAAIASLVAAVR